MTDTIPSTQKAIVVEDVGKHAVIAERPVPTPQQGEILVQITVAALNPYDKHVRDMGLYVSHRLPVVLCNDMAGIVRAIGPDTTTDLKVGDHVFGQTNYLKDTSDQCGLQQYALLDTAIGCAKVPEGFSDNEAATMITNVVSPFLAIFGGHGMDLKFPFPGTEDAGRDYSKETIVIIGGGSNNGKYAVQLCKLAGFGKIVVTANKTKNEQILNDYGATHVIDRNGSDVEVEEAIRAIVGDDLLYSLDCVNLDHNLAVSILSTTKKGIMVGLIPGFQNDFKFKEKAAGFEEKFIQGQSHNQPELGKKIWEFIPKWIVEGKIRSTGWTAVEGMDVEKVNKVLDDYGIGVVPPKQVHVWVHGSKLAERS